MVFTAGQTDVSAKEGDVYPTAGRGSSTTGGRAATSSSQQDAVTAPVEVTYGSDLVRGPLVRAEILLFVPRMPVQQVSAAMYL